MAIVTCSDQVQQMLEMLPATVREGVDQRIDYLADMPRMYAISQDDRYPGCRTFWVDPCYRVFYMVAAGADDVHVLALLEEEVDHAGEA